MCCSARFGDANLALTLSSDLVDLHPAFTDDYRLINYAHREQYEHILAPTRVFGMNICWVWAPGPAVGGALE